MNLSGSIHQFPKEIKMLILVFITTLSIGFFGGISFIGNTTSYSTTGIESNYLGNENDENAEVMKFKKSERDILTLVHNHILSLSVIFFLIALILATTSIKKGLKQFLMIEPFVSLVLTFGGIFLMWKGILWFKYVVLFSGILMCACYATAIILIFHQVIFVKK
ncbi:hypothetical protein R3X25_09255 [Lutibacter sp. TH_r2]|uniref:hypothetical protein n=1 Tax=Lutibacter sp. TH_r2 TaxID=3082083 RepID=UPI002953D6B2|nr:hypothetical protein [Lutibacter sp. TH_r2]MDV7187467.1 hypothetical protein [Lutibacter sp. TH_r2]